MEKGKLVGILERELKEYGGNENEEEENKNSDTFFCFSMHFLIVICVIFMCAYIYTYTMAYFSLFNLDKDILMLFHQFYQSIEESDYENAQDSFNEMVRQMKYVKKINGIKYNIN